MGQIGAPFFNLITDGSARATARGADFFETADGFVNYLPLVGDLPTGWPCRKGINFRSLELPAEAVNLSEAVQRLRRWSDLSFRIRLEKVNSTR